MNLHLRRSVEQGDKLIHFPTVPITFCDLQSSPTSIFVDLKTTLFRPWNWRKTVKLSISNFVHRRIACVTTTILANRDDELADLQTRRVARSFGGYSTDEFLV